MTELKNLRNFSIVAHIDHGKSTLADRLIQFCGGLTDREMKEQVLDSMELERERGITIKAQTVRLNYTAKDGKKYVLNIMDTPGHVDFSYEVSRSLAACESSLLIVDSTQGVEDLLEKIVIKLPSPEGNLDEPLKCMLVDSWYDSYLGVIVLVRVINGQLKKNQKIRFMAAGATHTIDRVGIFSPKPTEVDTLGPGEIGFINSGIKSVSDCKVGDTITEEKNPTKVPLPGFKPSQPVVFCGMFPVDSDDYEHLRESMVKKEIND